MGTARKERPVAKRTSGVVTLYHFPRTHSTRVRWWLEEAGVVYDSKLVDIRHGEQDTEEFRKISPLGRIPVLVDGDLIVHDSLAICLYLGFRFPDSGLCPHVGTRNFASYLQWLVLANADLDRVVGRFYAAHRARFLGKTRSALTLTEDSFLKLLAIYDGQLATSPFLVPERLSGADIFTASILAFADSIGLVPSGGPVRRWLDRMTRLPSYERALAPEGASPGETRLEPQS